MDRQKALKNLFTYISKYPEKVNFKSNMLVIPAIAGRVCYSSRIDVEDKRLNEEIVSYLQKLSKWTHFSVFAHLPVYIDIAPEVFFSLGLYNLFKSYYNKDNNTLYLNLRHLLEAVYTQGKADIVELYKILDKEKELDDQIKFIDLNIDREGNYIKNQIEKIEVDNNWDFFIIQDVDRATTHQIVRHQALNFNQQSQRYVKLKDVTIPVYKMDLLIKKIRDKKNWKDFINLYLCSFNNSIKSYKWLLDMGLPAEKARGVLPNDTPSHIIISGWRKDIDKFIQDRTTLQAQEEIRYIANKMKEIK